MMTFIDCARLIEQELLASDLCFGQGVDNAFDEAVWLIISAAEINDEPIDWQLILTAEQKLAVRELTDRRVKSRIPLAYLLKRAWFAGYECYIDQRAIIPRSYIGEWISDRFEPWLAKARVRSILDLCTGSGCIAVATALAFPEATIDATDISLDALDVANINITKYGVAERVQLFQGDLFNALPNTTQYDMILCNPPYVSDEAMASFPPEYDFEPTSAFSAGSDGLFFIRRILNEARQYLGAEGSIFIEVGTAAEAVEKNWSKVPFTWLTSLAGESPVLFLTAQLLDSYQENFVSPSIKNKPS